MIYVKWYFYDPTGRVTVVFHSQPPEEMLKNPYVTSEENFEPHPGYYQEFIVDIPTGKVTCNYIQNKPTIPEEIEAIKTVNTDQNQLLDVCLVGFDEMYLMLEQVLPPEMAATFKTKGVSGMVDVYVAMVMRGLRTIDQVPARYREQVKAELEALEK